MKLLGVTLDRHFTFGAHIDETVKKARGVLGSIARAAPHLPRELLKMAYTALIRSLLEYASTAFASASKTQLQKLETMQKMASRVICKAPRNTHSAPLLETLKLDSLQDRRQDHIVRLVDSILAGDTHPALLDMFQQATDGSAVNDQTARIGIGRRRFSIFAKETYNQRNR